MSGFTGSSSSVLSPGQHLSQSCHCLPPVMLRTALGFEPRCFPIHQYVRMQTHIRSTYGYKSTGAHTWVHMLAQHTVVQIYTYTNTDATHVRTYTYTHPHEQHTGAGDSPYRKSAMIFPLLPLCQLSLQSSAHITPVLASRPIIATSGWRKRGTEAWRGA